MTAVLNPPTLNTLSLADLSRATSDYLHQQVEVRIPRIARQLTNGDDGTFTVRVKNADEATGIRLEDVTVHLEVSDSDVIELSAEMSPIFELRETGSRSDPVLPRGALVGSMFVFFPQPGTFQPDDVLEPGEVIEFDVPYHAQGAGTTNLSAHVHASVSTDALFPRGDTDSAVKPVEILP